MLDVERNTHLTINRGRNVHADHGQYYSHETNHARKGINLLNAQSARDFSVAKENKVKRQS